MITLAMPIHCFSFFLSMQTDLGETYPAFLPAALAKILTKIFPLVISLLDTREKEKPEGIDLPSPLPLSPSMPPPLVNPQ
jgi:hypothetical protein